MVAKARTTRSRAVGTTRPLRADARATIDKVLDAAGDCLASNPSASVSEIARAAGVGRVTLYGHFPSREQLIEQALTRVLAQGDAELEGLDLSGEPAQALPVLVESSWLLIARAGAILEAAQAVLPPRRVQELHAKPAARVDDLVRRGQASGAFRADLPVDWMVSVMHHVMKGAATDVAAGRLKSDRAAKLIITTIMAAFTAPAT